MQKIYEMRMIMFPNYTSPEHLTAPYMVANCKAFNQNKTQTGFQTKVASVGSMGRESHNL